MSYTHRTNTQPNQFLTSTNRNAKILWRISSGSSAELDVRATFLLTVDAIVFKSSWGTGQIKNWRYFLLRTVEVPANQSELESVCLVGFGATMAESGTNNDLDAMHQLLHIKLKVRDFYYSK
jgi:hypothetical protein